MSFYLRIIFELGMIAVFTYAVFTLTAEPTQSIAWFLSLIYLRMQVSKWGEW